MSTTASEAGTGIGEPERPHKAGLFDIRTFIAALLGFDGLVILLAGIFGDDTTSSGGDPGANINLYVGIGLIVAAVLFESWKRLRPVKVDPAAIPADDSRPAH